MYHFHMSTSVGRAAQIVNLQRRDSRDHPGLRPRHDGKEWLHWVDDISQESPLCSSTSYVKRDSSEQGDCICL